MSPTRRLLLACTALLFAGACSKHDAPPPAGAPSVPTESRQTPPFKPPLDANLLFISLDTTRADHLGCYGYDRPTSPAIDRLAADAVRFTRFYTVMPTTLPSHAAMFTSLFPTQLGTLMNTDVVPPQADTLAERLKARGFATAAFVGAYPMDRQFGLDQGFDVYQCPPKSEWRARRVREMASAWLTAHAKNRFFCFVHMYDPHTWYEPPPEFARPFNAPDFRMPPEREFLQQPEQFTPDRIRQTINAYDAEIASADHEIGELLAALDRSGARDKTLVVFLSDHGETMDELLAKYAYAFDHGEFLHRRELRIPCVLWLPPAFALRGPAVCDQQAGVLDLLPTLMELLGLPCEKPFEGESLVPLLAGESRPTRRIVSRRHEMPGDAHAILQGGEFSILDGRWHWIRSEGRGDELFDMQTDPAEQTNLLGKHHEFVKMMNALLTKWRREKGPPLWGRHNAGLDAHGRAKIRDLGYLAGDEESAPASSQSSRPTTRPRD